MGLIETLTVIETRRLALRAPNTGDITRIAALAADPSIARMTCRMPSPFGVEDAEDFVMNVLVQDPRRANTFVIEHDDHGVVGVLGLFYGTDPAPELGYWIGAPYRGRGLATEAVEGALGWAKRGWKKGALVAGHFADNPASGRVLEKAGFLYTGETRNQFSLARGAFVDTRMMVWVA